MIKELLLTHPHSKKKSNPWSLFTMVVLIINDVNSINKFYNITEICKGSINKYILYHIDIIRVNCDERNIMRRGKRRLTFQTRMFSTTVLNNWPISTPPIKDNHEYWDQQLWVLGLFYFILLVNFGGCRKDFLLSSLNKISYTGEIVCYYLVRRFALQYYY